MASDTARDSALLMLARTSSILLVLYLTIPCNLSFSATTSACRHLPVNASVISVQFVRTKRFIFPQPGKIRLSPRASLLPSPLFSTLPEILHQRSLCSTPQPPHVHQ